MARSPKAVLIGLVAVLVTSCAKKEVPATSVDDARGTDSAEAPAEFAGKELNSPRKPDVEYVPTPQPVVEKMLALAKIQKTDVLYDLGCGDGRIVVTAAKKYGVKAVGYDIDPKRVAEARENVRNSGVEDLVTIEQEDIFKLDLSPASVITLYLLPELNVKLIPQLEKLQPGSRIVSHDFDMEGVEPEKRVKLRPPGVPEDHAIYLFSIPLKRVDK